MRLAPALLGGDRHPELEDARASFGHRMLVVNDAAAGEHPLQIAGAEDALVLVVNRALDEERRDLEAGVRMLAADRLARSHVDAVVHEDDERILLGEARRIEDGHRGASRA